MNRYYLQVITGYARDAGLILFTVEAESFICDSGCYTFYDNKGDEVALYPINRTIILKIEKI